MVAAAIDEVAAPALVGEDPLAHERLWEKLYWLLSPARPDRLCEPRDRGARPRAVGPQGQAPRTARVAPARRRARIACRSTPRSASASSIATSSPRRRATGWRRATGGSRWSSATTRSQRRDEPRPIADGDRRGHRARARGARGRRPRRPALRRRELQPRSVPRAAARALDRGLRHRVLRGADHAQRRAPAGRPAPPGAHPDRRRDRTRASPTGSATCSSRRRST